MHISMTLRAALISAGAGCLLWQHAAQAQYQPLPIATQQNHEKRFARIDGPLVVWTDLAYLGGPTSSNDIFGYDLSLHQPFIVANGSIDEDTQAISGDVVVWNEMLPRNVDSVDVFGRSIGGARFPVTTAAKSQLAPAISGNTVVWADARNGTQLIYGRKLDQPLGSDFLISPAQPYQQIFPDVSGNKVVWMSFQEPGGDQGNIYGKNLESGNVFPICTDPAYQLFPQIGGNFVTWVDWRQGIDRVYVKNLLTGDEFPVTPPGGGFDQTEPAIDGNLVVWMDSRNGTWDIWGYDLATNGPAFAITSTTNLDEAWPDVSGNIVVWEQSTDGKVNDIYGAVVPEPTVAVLGVTWGALAVLGRRRRN